jgi:hypothetical protein
MVKLMQHQQSPRHSIVVWCLFSLALLCVIILCRLRSQALLPVLQQLDGSSITAMAAASQPWQQQQTAAAATPSHSPSAVQHRQQQQQ